MAEKKDTKKKMNPGVIIGIAIAAVAVICVIVALCVSGGGKKPEEPVAPAAPKYPIAGVWKYKGIDSKYVFNDDGTV